MHPLTPFLEESRRLLTDEYPRKIAVALGRLDGDDLWWRPNDASNSVGNLLVHLAGNVRQWVVHGLGGAADERHRRVEFARRRGPGAEETFGVLMDAVKAADAVLADLDPGVLERPVRIQGVETTGLRALYHVVEHMAMHTGQILYVAKLRGGQDLGLYDVDDTGAVRGTRW
ncbi:MAG: DinB family protein [Gemmatimonadota bacterium]